VIASQAVRAAPSRRVVHPRPRHTTRAPRATTHARRGGATWEVRTFGAVTTAIACVFVIAMLYLAQATTVSTRGYEAQRLEQAVMEMRRQNALLEVENARLDSPARIESEATKLGLVRAATIPVVQLDPVQATTAKR
jgi:cell division protein FtsL